MKNWIWRFVVVFFWFVLQVDALRKIKLNHGDTNNVRPTQATGDRAEFYLYCKEEKQEEKNKD